MDSLEIKINNLAKEILMLSRNTLLVHMRFLDMALNRLDWIPISTSTILTNGKYIFYNPKHVLGCYKRGQEVPTRDYLHMVMHCVFRHMYMEPTLNRAYWDLACDIAVENVITELNLKVLSTERENYQSQFLTTIKKEVKQVTAEKIYAYLKQVEPDSQQIFQMQQLFHADNHEIWYMIDDEIANRFGNAANKQKNGDNQQKTNQTESENNLDQTGNHLGEQHESRIEMMGLWKTISERMQVDLESFGKLQGVASNALSQNLSSVNREKYDYSSFLKKFATLGEIMKINDDEFDYIYYTYGLQLYKKMPLIEPLEYKEIEAIKEFVIAIDTSGSTSGDLVQKFVQKTYNILKTTESFFSKMNLHIIQCDADIQEDKKITSQEEFDRYLENMQIHGLGGTDFRPVFEYVEQLRKSKEFVNLKGLIYFTDGYGTFPSQKPDYNTAFVFVDDEYNNPHVPPWAIKLLLKSDEI